MKPKKKYTVYLGIGTNKGNRIKNIEKALDLLCSHKKIKIIKVSQMLKNPPQEGIKTGYFLNGAIQVETEFTPSGLLRYCKQIEKKCGRSVLKLSRSVSSRKSTVRKYFSRTIDLDILFYEDKTINTKALTIPHPRIEDRYFVLLPLLDLDKKLIHPVLNITLDKLYKKTFGFKRRFR